MVVKETILQLSSVNRVSAPVDSATLSDASVVAEARGLGGAVKARRMTWWGYEFSGVEGAVVAIGMMFVHQKSYQQSTNCEGSFEQRFMVKD